ncbi:hypothetical protein CEXT_194501 [Caerostris extrusa]|uniref:Cytochrome c oxidase subunit 3 n=1 Tax=Caerostris extrusa TaxID=172846 RepID=A0AAV4MKZ9_CAEEX|nr:hypothetical protein CEXT_194501 [Caerostris extrusa]
MDIILVFDHFGHHSYMHHFWTCTIPVSSLYHGLLVSLNIIHTYIILLHIHHPCIILVSWRSSLYLWISFIHTSFFGHPSSMYHSCIMEIILVSLDIIHTYIILWTYIIHVSFLYHGDHISGYHSTHTSFFGHPSPGSWIILVSLDIIHTYNILWTSIIPCIILVSWRSSLYLWISFMHTSFFGHPSSLLVSFLYHIIHHTCIIRVSSLNHIH